jgi:PTS system mannose-specific IIA component
MLGLLVMTHGRLAEELVSSVRNIVGPVERLEAVSIEWNDDPEEATRRVREARERVDSGSGVLLLTDMFGGTPTNLALSMLEPDRFEIVTGVNLPMLIKFVSLRQQQDLARAAASIAEQGRDSIQVASRLLGRRGGADSSPAREDP